MEQATVGAIILASLVFCAGLVSAVASRRRRESSSRIQVEMRELHEQIDKPTEKSPNDEDGVATAMAGGGYGNVANGNAASQAARR